MGRWEPNPRERLVRAAIELFGEQGYDNTTVVQIAERAGLTKSTFFRHFPDKREVLFAGQDELCELLASGISAAPASATPWEAVASALDAAAGAFVPQRRDFGPVLREVTESNRELRERLCLKRASFADTMTRALEQRGVRQPAASLAATIGVLAISHGYARWADPANQRGYAEVALEALHELRTSISTLDHPPEPRPRR